MPLQPRCHTLRPDRASGWLVFFQLVKEAGRTGTFLVVGPGGERTRAAREGAVAAGQQTVRYFKETPGGAPAATLVEGAMTLLVHESASLGLPLEFGCGVIEETRLWVACRGRVRLVPVSPRLGAPLGSEEPAEVPISSQVRLFFGRFPEEFEDPRLASETAQRIERGEVHEGGLIFSFAEVESLRDVAPPLRATRAVTPLTITRSEPVHAGEAQGRLELVVPHSPQAAHPAAPAAEPAVPPRPGVEPPAENGPAARPVTEPEPETAPQTGSSRDGKPQDKGWGPEETRRPADREAGTAPAAPGGPDATPEPAAEPQPAAGLREEASPFGAQAPGTVAPEPAADPLGPDAPGSEAPAREEAGPAKDAEPEAPALPSSSPPQDAREPEAPAPSVPVPAGSHASPDTEVQEDLFAAWRREFEAPDPELPDEAPDADSHEPALAVEESGDDPGAGDPAAGAPTAPYSSSPRPGHPVARSVWSEAPTTAGASPASPPLGAPYAAEETRGIGFWLALVAAFGAVALLVAYLTVLRPGGDEAAPPAAGDTAPEVAAPVTPTVAWTATFDKAVSSSPATVGDLVVFGCRDGKVYALRAADGERVWAYGAADGFGSSPVHAGDLIVIGGYDARIHALRAATGEEAWSTATGGRIVASPAHDGSSVYVGSYDRKLYALSLEDGAVRWSRDLGAVLWASPVAAGDRVVAAGLDGTVSALDAATGKILWRQTTGGDIYSSPAVGEGKVFVGSKDRHVYAFDLASGEPLWKIAAPAPVLGSAAYHEGRLVIGAEDGTVLGIDAGAGRVAWTARTGDAVKSRPAFDGPRVWVTGYDGALTGFDRNTGELSARFEAGTPAFSSPAVREGRVFFGGMDGRFFAVSISAD